MLKKQKFDNPRTTTKCEEALSRGLKWLLPRIENDAYQMVSPIGFYFAKLWYFEAMYPLVFVAGALNQVDQLLQKENLEPQS